MVDGPFKGMDGPVLEVLDEGESLTLALTVMGRDTAVTIPASYAERLETAPVASRSPPSEEEAAAGEEEEAA